MIHNQSNILPISNKKPKKIMSDIKYKACELDAESIAFYRRNPCIASRDLLGIELLDSQKYILQNSWNATNNVWACCRNFGKSFLGAVFMILKALLYENQGIYIVSSVGNQSKETFTKIEEIVLRIGKTSASMRSLTDVVSKETVKNANNKTGFKKPPESWSVSFYNGSVICTLNSNPDNNRGKRATLIFFDEAAFCTDELISACVAFAMQNTDFATSTDSEFDSELEPLKIPTQLIFASSQDDMEKEFYKRYKDCARKMLAGNRSCFVCDMICDVAIETYLNGKKFTPLLTREKVDAELRANEEKAMREFYNRPTMDGGISQIIKWGLIRRNEKFILPALNWTHNELDFPKYIFAFDPARSGDNSIIGVMELYEDTELGLCGRIINCINNVDTATRKKFKLDSNRQLDVIRETILKYNGDFEDYVNIDSLLIDAGSGGGGVSAYADPLLNNFTDKLGIEHRGLIDSSYDNYVGFDKLYPLAINKLKLISPNKYRSQMVVEFIDLMTLGCITFPEEYSGKDYIPINKGVDNEGNEIIENYELSEDEKLALINIDLMKREIANIHKYTNQDNTSVTYALSKEKANKMHDDRFYVAIMLAHRLSELRRMRIVKQKPDRINIEDYVQHLSRLTRKPKMY